MRNLFNGICLIALMIFSIFSSQPAAAANTPSINGTTIPSATQIVDMNLNVWTLSGWEGL